MATKALRPYQTEAVIALWDALHRPQCVPLIVLPTGTGKSLCVAEFTRGWLGAYPDHKVLIVTPSQELVGQNHAEMMELWPQCDAGICSAGFGRYDTNNSVIFGSIQTLFRRAFKLQRVNAILVDEAQGIPKTDSGMWAKFLKDVKTINPDVVIGGFTATPYRLDSGMLHEGEGALFSEISFEYPVNEAIEAGYLAEPVSVGAVTQIDTTGIGKRGGDFIPAALEAAAMENDTVERLVDELVLHGADRRGWILFGCGVEHCMALRDALRTRGISCEGVFATTPKKERRDNIAAFKRQEIRALVSVVALTVGFNAPHADMLGFARATASPGLYVQAIGRVLRTCAGKQNALIMDFGGNLARFGPIDAVRVKAASSKGEGDAPVKKCPECEASCPISAQECADCGHEFPAQVSKVTVAAANAAVLSSQIKPEWVEVSDVTYKRHKKQGKPDSLAVTYICGLAQHREWVCIDHTGFAKTKATAWWKKRAPGGYIPNTVSEALDLANDLPQPSAIQVRQNGKYTEIIGAKFE